MVEKRFGIQAGGHNVLQKKLMHVCKVENTETGIVHDGNRAVSQKVLGSMGTYSPAKHAFSIL